MRINTDAHLSDDQHLEFEIKSGVIDSKVPFTYHVVKLNGSNGVISLYLSVEQMIDLKNELNRGITNAQHLEAGLQLEKSEEEVNG